jgi:hypothetical protein
LPCSNARPRSAHRRPHRPAGRPRRGRSALTLRPLREAIERYLTDDPAAAIDAAIVDSYARAPPDEDFGAAWAARQSIEAGPWEDAT